MPKILSKFPMPEVLMGVTTECFLSKYDMFQYMARTGICNGAKCFPSELAVPKTFFEFPMPEVRMGVISPHPQPQVEKQVMKTCENP